MKRLPKLVLLTLLLGMVKFALPLLALFTIDLAFAQAVTPDATLPNFDFKAWGSSAFLFGGFVVAAVSLIRGRVPKLNGYAVLALSLVISEVGAFILYTAGWLTDPTYIKYAPPYVWLMFGLAAFVVASGGWAALAGLLTARKSVVAIPITVNPGPQRQVPVGTPGSEVLHQLDGTKSAVMPLTPGQPVLVSKDEAIQ